MFQSEQLIYIHMQKTGGTHITSLLSDLFEGNQIGNHNAAKQIHMTPNKYFISSIRNPWDWYLSLWTFGAQGNGDLMHRLTNKRLLGSLKSTVKNPIKNHSHLFRELLKDVTLWRDAYDRGNDIKSFRKWLKLIHNPNNSLYLGEGYGDTAITRLCGFMTYRYLYLCCRNVSELSSPALISNYTDLVRFENNNCYIDFFIRQESLAEDLCVAIEKVRFLTQENKSLIYKKKKTNTSKRELLISDYYDKESIELIRNRDRLLVDKFDYSPPQISE